MRRRLKQGDRVFVFQGLGGLGKSTLAFHTLPLLGPREAHAILWCQRAEKENDPVEGLVSQLVQYGRGVFGEANFLGVEQQVDRAAGSDPVARFAAYLGVLVQNLPRLILYLDNLESLLTGPADRDDAPPDPAAFAAWKTPALARLWRLLHDAAHRAGNLFIVASCRYRHADFDAALFPVAPMPPDALFRLTEWFPILGRLTPWTRQRLANTLDGHPRAVTFADKLIGDALIKWSKRHGRWQPANLTREEAEREWHQFVAPALPQVQEKLWADLLLAQLWQHVLDDDARRLLYRLTLLRRPCDWNLLDLLATEATTNVLLQTSLLEQVNAEGEPRFTVHPATATFVQSRLHDAALTLDTHRRLGDYLEKDLERRRYIETYIEAGYHLFQAGAYNRAYTLLGSASDWLQDHSRVREGLLILEPFLAESILPKMDRKLTGELLGTVGLAYAALGQVDKAIGYHEQYLAIAREIGDRRGEGNALGNLGIAYKNLGQVDKALGYYEQQLVIVREIGDRRGEGAALGNLGLAYADLGQVDQAIGYYEQHLAIAREIGDRLGEGAALGNLGLAYAALGQVDQAIGYYEQALVIDREIGDRRGEGADLGNLGNAYAALGQVAKGIGLLEQALRIGQETKDAQILRVATAQLQRLRGGSS